MSLLQRLRGALGFATMWSVAWVGLSLALFALFKIFDPDDIGEDGLGVVVPILATVGFLCGLGFAGLLALLERHKALERLSLVRVAIWGFAGSAGIPLLMGADGSMWPVTGTVGAILATTSVAVARRPALPPPAERDYRPQPEP